MELELNARLRTFAVNCSLMYGGHNTVQAQLKYKSKRGTHFIKLKNNFTVLLKIA